MATVRTPVRIGGHEGNPWTVAPPQGSQNGDRLVALLWSDADGDA